MIIYNFFKCNFSIYGMYMYMHVIYMLLYMYMYMYLRDWDRIIVSNMYMYMYILIDKEVIFLVITCIYASCPISKVSFDIFKAHDLYNVHMH